MKKLRPEFPSIANQFLNPAIGNVLVRVNCVTAKRKLRPYKALSKGRIIAIDVFVETSRSVYSDDECLFPLEGKAPTTFEIFFSRQ